MALQLVESVFINGQRVPAIALVGSINAPAANPSADLPMVESIEDGGFRYPAYVLVDGTATAPAGGEPLVESVEFEGARYKAIAFADTTLVAAGNVDSVVISGSRYICFVQAEGTEGSPTPGEELVSGTVVNGGRYKFIGVPEAVNQTYFLDAPLETSLRTGKFELDAFSTEPSPAISTVTNFDGSVKYCEGNEARFDGARRVCNFAPENIPDSWSPSSFFDFIELPDGVVRIEGNFGGDVSNILNMPLRAGSAAAVQGNVNAPVVASIEIRRAPGFDNFRTVELRKNDFLSADKYDITNVITSEWQRFAAPAESVAIAAGGYFGYRIEVYGGAGQAIEVRNIQSEVVDPSNTLGFPSEYVSYGEGVEANILPAISATDWSPGFWGAIEGNAIRFTNLGGAGAPAQCFADLPRVRAGEKWIIEYDISELTDYTDQTLSLKFAQLSPAGGPASLTNLPIVEGRNTAEVVMTADYDVDNVVSLAFQIGLGTGTINQVDFVLSNITARIADHGARADGVKYFNTELTTVVDPVTRLVTNPGPPVLLSTLKGIRMEPANTNFCQYSADTTGASWGGTLPAPAVTAVEAPDGNTMTNVRYTSTAANQTKVQFLGGSAQTLSCWMKRVSGTGPILLVGLGGTLSKDISSEINTETWTRVYGSTVGLEGAKSWGFEIGTSGDSIDVWGFQIEAFVRPTSYIPTPAAAAVVRAATDLSIIDPGIVGTEFSFAMEINDNWEALYGKTHLNSASVTCTWVIDLTTYVGALSSTDTIAYDAGLANDFVPRVKYGLRFSPGQYQQFVTGTASGAPVNTTTGNFITDGVIILGNQWNGTTPAYANYKDIRFYNKYLTQQQMEDLTA